MFSPVRPVHPGDRGGRAAGQPAVASDPQLPAVLDRLGPAGHAELAVDGLGVGLDRVRRDEQFLADLAE